MVENTDSTKRGQAEAQERVKWEYFIRPDKTATPVFDELCRGLAQIIRTLEPTNDVDLSPARLANHYRNVSGNFDELFLKSDGKAVGFLYRTLGCYHSLQPNANPFLEPDKPCLTDDGFVRWQTMQLLLSPEDQTRYIERAVQEYDVPRMKGGFFPKVIPQFCFPAAPDPQMEAWYSHIMQRVDEDVYTRRLKNSPHASPYRDTSRSPDGYFGRSSTAGMRRMRGSNRESCEDEQARLDAYKRRSSVPNVPSPGDSRRGDEDNRKSRSHSAKRAEEARIRSRSRPVPVTTDSGNHLRPVQPREMPLRTAAQRRPSPREAERSHHSSSSSVEKESRPFSHHERTRSSRSREASAEDASSEESDEDRRRNRESRREQERDRKYKSIEDMKKRPPPPKGGLSSLMPSFLSSNKRRHSSDGRIPQIKDVDRSRKHEPVRKVNTEGPSPRPFEARQERQSNVRFNSNVFSDDDPPYTPGRPIIPPPAQPPSSYRYSEPVNTFPAPGTVPNMMPMPPQSQARYPISPPQYSTPGYTVLPNQFSVASGVPWRRRDGSASNNPTSAPDGHGRRYTSAESSGADQGKGRSRTSSMRNPAVASMV